MAREMALKTRAGGRGNAYCLVDVLTRLLRFAQYTQGVSRIGRRHGLVWSVPGLAGKRQELLQVVPGLIASTEVHQRVAKVPRGSNLTTRADARMWYLPRSHWPYE